MVRESEYLSFCFKTRLTTRFRQWEVISAGGAYGLDMYNHLRRLNERRRQKKSFAPDVQDGPKDEETEFQMVLFSVKPLPWQTCLYRRDSVEKVREKVSKQHNCL